MNKNYKLIFLPVALFTFSLTSCKRAPAGEPVITYTLDSDIVLKAVDNDIEVVTDAPYPGKSIRHKNDHSNANFNIMAFTDLHLDHNQNTCNYTFSMLARNIMHANPKPDLIVFCGDNITSSLNEPRTIQFAEMLEKLGVYWSAVLGNHERNARNPKSIERDKMINIWCKYPHCLIDNTAKKTKAGLDVWGVGNTLINLISDKGVTQSLYFLDSGTEMNSTQMDEYSSEIGEYKTMNKCSADETEFYDYIKNSQISWYKETFTKVKEKVTSDIPHTTIFTHVPIYEQEKGYIELFKELGDIHASKPQTYGKSENIRAFTDYPQDADKCKDVGDLYSNENGYVKGERTRRREDLCYSPHDLRYKNDHTPIFQAMKDFGYNNAFFCGHDHQNNYTIKWDGQFLGYIQPGCYSSNNLYTKGMLGNDPYVEGGSDTAPYDGHLIQGYSTLEYKNESGTFKNILSNVTQHESKTELGEDLYKRAIDLIKAQKGNYKGDKSSDYLERK